MKLPGASVITISGGDVTQIMSIGFGLLVSISDLTLSDGNGDFGGAIISSGELSLTNVVVADNETTDTGGGIYNDPDGILNVANSLFTGNTTGGDGGGITNDGEMHLVNVTLFNNSALYGGAISNLGFLDATNVTITGNHADIWGGGIFTDLDTVVTLVNTIVALNTADDEGPDLNGEFDGLTSSNSIIGDGTASTGIDDGTNSNQVGTDVAPIDPLLGVLQDNGGSMQTFSLLLTSPAIDAGTNTGAPATDQRGFNRIVNTTADIGAYEYQPPETAVSTPTSSGTPSIPGEDVTFTVTVAGVADGSNTPTGTVTFFDGATELGTVDLVDGEASFVASGLTVGDHIITATYNGVTIGDFEFDADTSDSFTQVVAQGDSTTVVTSSASPSFPGQDVIFTATVSATGGTPTGDVEFFDGVTSLGTFALVGGIASVTVNTLSLGDHSITAVYEGDTSFNGSTSDAVTQTVAKADTTAVVVSDGSPSFFGDDVTFTVTVSATGGTPTGDVEFFDGVTSLGTVALVGGTASVTVNTLTVGDHSITAVYEGDDSFNADTSDAITQTVNKQTVTITLTSSAEPSTFQQTITLTATLTPDGGSGTATGQVEFFDGATSLGTATLTNNIATLDVSTLSVGSHSITATYAGDDNFETETSTALSQTVNKALTNTTLVITPNPAGAGTTVTYTATVVGVPTGTVKPTGMVVFVANPGTASEEVIGSAALDANGEAEITSSALGIGTHTVVAQYGEPDGDQNFLTSESSPIVFNVQGTTTTTVVSSKPKTNFNEEVTFTATVTPTGGGTATGNVTFLDGTKVLGTTALSNGVATLTTKALLVGGHKITARFEGQGELATSTSSQITQNVVNGDLFAVAGSPGQVQWFTKEDGAFVDEFTAFEDTTSNVSVAWGDMTGDGFAELIVARTEGQALIRIYDGAAIADGTFTAADPDAFLLAEVEAFDSIYNVGAFVAATDVNGDGFMDLITAASLGNPHVKIYNGKAVSDGTLEANPESHLLGSYFAYAPLNQNMGVNVAGGDVNNDGNPDVITAASSGNPHVKVYDGASIKAGTFAATPENHVLVSFIADALGTGIGATVAVGDTNGDGFGDIITAAVATTSDVRVFSGKAVADNNFNVDTSQLDQFFAFELQFAIGVALGAADFDDDGIAEIVTGAKAGSPHYRVVAGDSSGVKPPATIDDIAIGIGGGINVAV